MNLSTKCGYIATLGRPNAGKSTLLNALAGEHIALISHKANATRKQQKIIISYKNANFNAQLIFVDTPGIHKKEKLLNQYMLDQALKAMGDCDICIYLAPISDEIRHYEEFLKLCDKPHLLLLSKSDLLDSKFQLKKIAEYQAYKNRFIDLVPISVKKGFDRDKILELIAKNLPQSPFLYEEDLLSTDSVKEICKELIMESVFENTSDEIPYESAVIIKSYKSQENLENIYAKIIVEKNSQKGVMIGKNAATIKRIGIHARQKIESFLQKKVYLNLVVEVKKGWSKQSDTLKKIGYDFSL